MTFFIRSFAPLRPASRTLLRPATFHTSTSRWAMSETDRAAYHELTPDNHKDDPNRDEKIEHHKQDSVQKAKKGDAEWKPELASSSEQAVAGEKTDMSMEEMQKMGEKKAEEGKTPSGSSSSGKH